MRARARTCASSRGARPRGVRAAALAAPAGLLGVLVLAGAGCGATVYKANASGYDKKLDALDAWISRQVGQIPQADRKLVTDHASMGFFADRYGFTVVGTVLPSVSTDETPTARQLADLTRTIRETGARAIFVDASDNPQLAEQIGAETGVRVVTGLLDHSLAAAGGEAPTYIDVLKYNTRQIVEALR